MRRLSAALLGFAAILVLGGPARGDDPPAPAAGAGIPDPAPYLDVKGASLVGVSRDGKVVVFLKRAEDTVQVWHTDPEGKEVTRVTQRKDAVDFAALSPDGSKVVVGYDKDGDENAGLFLVDVTGESVGKERELIATPGVQHGDVRWSQEGDRIFFRSNADSKADFHLYEMTIADGKTRRVLAEKGSWAVEDVAPGGKSLLVVHTWSNYDSSIYVLDVETGVLREIDPKPAGKTVAPGDAHFLGKGDEVVFLSDRDGEHRWAYVATLATGVIRGIPVPEVGIVIPPDMGEIDEAVPSLDGKRVFLVENFQGWSRMFVVDPATGASTGGPCIDPASGNGLGASIVSGLKPDEAGEFFFTENNSLWGPATVMRGSADLHRSYVVMQPDFGSLPHGTFHEAPKQVAYRSLDGRRIPAWLLLPKDHRPKTLLPFIVHVHGGPEGQSRPYFSGETEYLLSLGFGILEPNIRGSTGYGKTYRDLDNYKGRLDSVRDVKAAADWLADAGYADPKRIAVMGGSYGGYMVLACLTEYPDTFAAGVEAVGIANFETFLERTAPYRRALREAEYGPLTDREFLRSISPIHKVDKIIAPLLIAHGEQDPRVPVGEARQMEAALKALGRPVEAIYFPDEGHGWQKKSNRLIYLKKVAEFLTRYLHP